MPNLCDGCTRRAATCYSRSRLLMSPFLRLVFASPLNFYLMNEILYGFGLMKKEKGCVGAYLKVEFE